jgi:hypothetical protein
MAQIFVEAIAPVIRQATDSFQETLQVENLNFNSVDGIGFDKCTFLVKGSPTYLRNWFQFGLIRDITLTGPQSESVWNGYVGRMVFSYGGSTMSVSVEGMSNRVIYVYTPLDTTEDPPVKGAQATITQNDTVSQALYGIKTSVVSGNELPTAVATSQSLKELNRRKHLTRTQTLTPGQGKPNQIQFECYGYGHMLKWWNYTDTVSTGTTNASTLVATILADDPNSVISSDTRDIWTNTTAMDVYYDGKTSSLAALQKIASRGREVASEGYPWTFGIYEGRRAIYKAAEYLDDDDVALSTNQHLPIYRQYNQAADQYLDGAGNEIPAYLLRPDRLIYNSDIPGRPLSSRQTAYTGQSDTATVTGNDRLYANIPIPQFERSDPPSQNLSAFYYAKDGDIVPQDGRNVYYNDGGVITPITPQNTFVTGMIIAWSGAIGAIPTGFVICDGNNGTPDLRNRFIMGAGDTYAVGATGGALTVDSSHQHTVGTLAAAGESSHTHGNDDLVADSDSHSHNDTFSIDNDTHSHDPGDLQSATESSHTHDDGTYAAAIPSPITAQPRGTSTSNVVSKLSFDSHTHDVTGASGLAGVHDHIINRGTTANDQHNHGISGSVSSDAHTHTISGDTAAGTSHTHTLSGSVASGGSATLAILNPYHALAYIMKT